MFGFGKNKYKPEKDSDIFSAEHAKQMVTDALLKRRNEDRAAIFNGIKSVIRSGGHEYMAPGHLLANGNDVYFEGLGYKLKKLWYDNWAGQYVETPPEETQSNNPVDPPTTAGTLQIDTTSFNWSNGIILSGTDTQRTTRRQSKTYQPYIKLSWE